jgi:hypothetical protein
MPRIRYLKPDFFTDEDLAELPYQTRLFFAGMWCQADKAGRLQDRPKKLKAVIFPYDHVDAEKCLQQLAQPKNGSGKPFINRYESDGQRYIQILTWDEHQKPHHTEKDSQIPSPPHTPPMGKGMGSVQLASTRLRNGDGTVKQPLCSTSPDAERLATLLLELITTRKPTFRKPTKAAFAKWTQAVGRMIRLDKREPSAVEAVIRWCQADDFWQNNILSGQKLRKQFDQLELKMGKSGVSLDGKRCFQHDSPATWWWRFEGEKHPTYFCDECQPRLHARWLAGERPNCNKATKE